MCSVQLSCSVMSDCLQPHGLQHARLPCPSPTPGVYLNACPLSRRCHPTISSSVFPFSSTFNLFQHQGLFKQISSSHQVARVLEFQLQHQSFQWILRTDFLKDEQDRVSPSLSLSHQEASISLLSFSNRGQTDWKPQPQKTNQSDHMDHSLL